MPRKGVPYGGAVCSLKERIAELFDLVGEKLHSINGVQGDGQGNVQIASGDDAVVITNDQIGHKIKVGLDKSKLPSNAVSSVNGETGAVVLDAGDIPSRGNSNVQADIDAEASARASAVSAEASARQEADSTLQASIDAEAQARADADSALQSAVDAEASARAKAVSDEAAARQTAVAKLQGTVDAEAQTRANADSALQSAVDAEASARAKAVSDEAAARASADTALRASIDALQTADGQNVKINNINEYAVGLTGNQSPIAGAKHFASPIYHITNIPLDSNGVYRENFTEYVEGTNNDIVGGIKYSNGNKTARRNDYICNRINGVNYKATLRLQIDPTGNVKLIMLKDIDGTETQTIIASL